MSIEKISERILSEARDEAEFVLANARHGADSVLYEAGKRAEELASEYALRASDDARLLKERRKTAAELEAKKLVLAAKQEMIEKSFSEAVRQLSELPEEEYLAFLRKQLPKDSEGGELILNERDAKRGIGEKLGGYSVSPETADIAGGFILRKGNVDINASIEAIVEARRKELTAAAANILFGGEAKP